METLTERLAENLKGLRLSRGWSLDHLAEISGVSRATLSRLENAATSPTAEVLGRLCAAYGLAMSRLLMMVEDGFDAHVPLADQPEWEDPETGFTRRSVSPPSQGLAAEVLECHLPPGTTIAYPGAPTPGQEHHLVLLDGALSLTLGLDRHDLTAGDCLRYKLTGPSVFATSPARGARYILILV